MMTTLTLSPTEVAPVAASRTALAERRAGLVPPRPAPVRTGGVSATLTLLDWSERLVVLALYAGLIGRMLMSYWAAGGGAPNLLLLPSEGLVVLFILIRRSTANVSRKPGEWLLALLATCAPLLVATGGAGGLGAGRPQSYEGVVPVAAAATVLLMGMVIQLLAKLALGRSMGLVPANRGLKLAGPYRFVRHPMYAGYLLSHLAFLAMNPTLWNLAVYALAYGLQVPRLFAEERLLARDPEYGEYQARVPYRLIPGLF
jgi:protein-S-isoprenylcysteine O-methyltransferase Ste14